MEQKINELVRLDSMQEGVRMASIDSSLDLKNAFENAQRFFTPQGTAQEQYLKHFGRKAKAEGMSAIRTEKIASFVLQMKESLRIKRLPWHRRDRCRWPRTRGGGRPLWPTARAGPASK